MRKLMIVLIVVGFTSNTVFGQPATFDSLILDNGGVLGSPTLTFWPNGDSTNRFRITVLSGAFDLDSPVANRAIRVDGNAKTYSFVIGGTGVGIGTFPQNSGLHIKSGDACPFKNARLHIENQDLPATDRTQLRLSNNGPARITLADTNIGSAWSLITTSGDQFQIRKNGPGTPNMAILPDGSFNFRVGGANNLSVRPNGNLIVGGIVVEGSDRNLKKNIVSVDPLEVLKKVCELPVSHWTYKKESDDVRHMGPMAQDFHAAFGLGMNNKTISTLDSSGVALAAIKGLHQQLQSKDAKIEELSQSFNQQLQTKDKQIEKLSELLAKMSERLDQLESQSQAPDLTFASAQASLTLAAVEGKE